MISVIVPVYNVAAYLDRCVNSIVNQTYTDLEIILIDDGSPDQCGEMCEEWAKKDSRIKVVHKENGGLSDARNAGIEVAKGDYIGFVDSDDWIDKEMYQDLLNAIEYNSADLAVTGLRRIYENGHFTDQFVSNKSFVLQGDMIVYSYLKQGVFSTAVCDKLFKATLFENRRFPVGRLFEDAPVIFDILCSIERLAIIGKPQYNYFQRADSICGQNFTSKKMDHYEFSKQIRDRVKEQYPKYNEEADVFWGCKICEILYSLNESNNKYEFHDQEKVLCEEIKKNWKKVLADNSVPSIMKLKIVFARFNLTQIYIKIRNLHASRA